MKGMWYQHGITLFEEMPMRKIRSRETQANLFHPEKKSPAWDDLPASVREDVKKLMADLLLSHLTKAGEIPVTEREGGHE
jgi:hypothetical protein